MDKLFFKGMLFCFLIYSFPSMAMQKCFYVSSYHQGYSWSDGIEKGVRRILKDKCDLKQFDMNTKYHKSEDDKRNSAKKAVNIINSWKPDIVITSDDNAARYLIQQHYKNTDLPFVFCGVNWTVKDYGFPYFNVTGMLEVAPIEPMLKKAIEFSKGNKAFYLGADTLTEKKNFKRFQAAENKMGISIESKLVLTRNDWIVTYKNAQQNNDFLIIGSSAGINDWDDKQVYDAVQPITKKLSVTNHNWMMSVTMLGFTKIPEEQGEWAAQVALSILNGRLPMTIPIVANRKWDLWINEKLINVSGLNIPASFKRRAKKQ